MEQLQVCPHGLQLLVIHSCSYLQPSLRILALTLPLGLSRDDDALPSVTSSSVRVLGVYCTLSCLREVRAIVVVVSPFSYLLLLLRIRPFSRTVGQPSFML